MDTAPDSLAGLGVDYRWYLRCSTLTDVDTVAIAVPVTWRSNRYGGGDSNPHVPKDNGF